jgi:hypothetical protein
MRLSINGVINANVSSCSCNLCFIVIYVLRRIFGPKRDEVTGEWRKLHNEELNDPYSSLNFVRGTKSRRM